MSDELDKFVLKYEVQMNDAIAKLEKLHTKTKKIEEESDKAGQSLKKFASEGADELGKLLPMVSSVSSAVKAMAGEFAVAGAAIGLVAAGVGAAMMARDQYNKQRTDGRDSGVSGVRMEDLQRKLVINGRGNVTRDMVAEGMTGQADLLRDAQSDITGQNETNTKLRLLQFQARGADGQPLSNMDLLKQEGSKWANMPDAKVMAEAKTLGMNPDLALAIKGSGKDIGKSSLTKDDIDLYQRGAESTKKFNDELSKFNEQINELTVSLGSKLLPIFGNLVEGANKLVNGAKDQRTGDEKVFYDTFLKKRLEQKTAKLKPWEMVTKADQVNESSAKEAEAATEKWKKDKAAEAEKKAGPKAVSPTMILDKTDQENKQFQQTATDFQTAVNMFAASVSNMSGAISSQEIMTNLFRGTGGTMFNQPVSVPQPGATGPGSNPTQYDAPKGGNTAKYEQIYTSAEKANGLPAGILQRIGSIENNPQDPTAVNKTTGAAGVMQVMPSNFESLGIKDWKDPKQNIEGAAKLLAQYLKMAKGDMVKALSMYNVGTDARKFNLPRVKKYVSDVLGPNNPSATIGKTTQSATPPALNVNDAQMYAQTRAKVEGKPVTQIVGQGDTVGDLERTKAYTLRMAQNAAIGAQAKVEGLENAPSGSLIPNGTIARAAFAASATSADLLRVQRGQEANQFSRPGDATALTANVPQVTVNAPITINGAHNPEDTANAVKTHLAGEVANAVNQNTTNVVR